MIRSRRLKKVIGGSMIISDVLRDVVEQIQMSQAAAVCNDCFHEIEKIWNAFDEKVDIFCEKYNSDFPKWYDDKNKSCTELGREEYYSNKGFEVFENFGADDNKCLKAKSEYLIQLENSKCSEEDDLILRCIYDRHYQLEETKNSCETME